MQNQIIIDQIKKWINEVVIQCNFCPFAAKEMQRGSVHFTVIPLATTKLVLENLALSFRKMEVESDIETLLLILPESFLNFSHYLDLLDLVETLLKKEGWEGIYQLASFHPTYKFAGTVETDPSNYTNRSPHPVIQILRESSISRAVEKFKDIDKIPARNIAFANKAGLAEMIRLRNTCFHPF